MPLLKSSARVIPADFRRLALINPTRYLGNLLIAGGLIQAFAGYCQSRNVQLLLVLDGAFADLCADAFTGIEVLYYPRKQIAEASPLVRLRLYGGVVRRIRKFKADIAFNLEEDTLTSRLTRHSGARFRLGCSPRHRRGYEYVLPIQYTDRPPGRRHRCNSFQEIFAAVGLPATQCSYLDLHINQVDEGLSKKLYEHGVATDKTLVAIHTSATKDYKKWPEAYFSELCRLLMGQGMQPLLIGAGPDDMQRCKRILQELDAASRASPAAESGNAVATAVNLCNLLSLRELAQLFLRCSGIVGNDSGPFHLAAAQKLPGVVIFGPSDSEIWGPLGNCSDVMQRNDLCDPGCTRRACLAGYRCLHGISPQAVMTSLLKRINRDKSDGKI